MEERYGLIVAQVREPPLSFNFLLDKIKAQVPYPVETRSISSAQRCWHSLFGQQVIVGWANKPRHVPTFL
jgi:hypothetical protein